MTLKYAVVVLSAFANDVHRTETLKFQIKKIPSLSAIGLYKDLLVT
jgi:hypothetical protein